MVLIGAVAAALAVGYYYVVKTRSASQATGTIESKPPVVETVVDLPAPSPAAPALPPAKDALPAPAPSRPASGAPSTPPRSRTAGCERKFADSIHAAECRRHGERTSREEKLR